MEVDDAGFLMEPTKVEIDAGYTLSVNYDANEKPVVNIKTFGKVDLGQLRKEILRAFPDAKIQQLNQTEPVTVVKAKRADGKRSR